GVSVLYVTHRLDEIFELSSRVTVLRDGCNVTTRPTSEMSRDQLIQLMGGRELMQVDPAPRAAHAGGEVLLEVRRLSRSGVFAKLSFEVRAGEIVGMAGLVGAGRSEVARVIFGADRADSGDVRVGGEPLRGNS